MGNVLKVLPLQFDFKENLRNQQKIYLFQRKFEESAENIFIYYINPDFGTNKISCKKYMLKFKD